MAQRIYRAEDQTEMRMPPEPMMSLEEVLDFVRHITSKEWWLRRSLYPVVRIRDGRGDDRALTYVGDGIMNLPKWSRKRPVIVHELTHILTNYERPHHGVEFAANLLDMYSRYLSKRWGSILEDRLVANKIEWTGPKYRERFTVVRPTYDVPRARKPQLVVYS